ncbi:MAG: hypothetical protein PHE55_10910 [Methylococcaceae bacterium]|nr:hypothetical protein [Methylococcaceae bacterium]
MNKAIDSLALLFLCLAIIGTTWIILGHQLSLWSRPVCPQGFWRESPGHCAFPWVSILQLGFTYGVISVLLLAAATLLAPVRKFTACLLLLAGLALAPAYTLIFKKFSWVALVSLSSIIAITLCFLLGAIVMRGIAVKRDIPGARPLP